MAPSPPPAGCDGGVNAASRLTTLPEELLSNISVKLGSDDVCALRLTCKDVEVKTLHEFGLEYFSKKCFMFTTASLKVLVNIASSKKLQTCLRHVYIIPVHFPSIKSGCSCAAQISTMRQQEAFAFLQEDQKRLREDDGDRRFLVDAFTKLPALKALTLIDSTQDLLPDCECRGLNKIWRDIQKEPSFAPNQAFSATYLELLSHVFKTMMFAVAESGIDTLESVDTSIRHDFNALSPLTDLNFNNDTRKSLAAAFINLTHVGLVCRTQSLHPGQDSSVMDYNKSLRAMERFATLVRSTSSLSLRFDLGDLSSSLCRTMLHRIDVGKLKTLALEGVHTRMTELAAVICCLRSTEFLTLKMCELADGSWVPILEALEKLPQLKHLHLQYLQHRGCKVFFLDEEDVADEQDHWLDPQTDGGSSSGTSGDGTEFAGDHDSETHSELLDWDLPPFDMDEEDPSELALQNALAEKEQKDKEAALAAEESRRKRCQHYHGKDHKPPGFEHRAFRGFAVCLEGDEIREQLPVFREQYNVGGSIKGPFDPLHFNVVNTLNGPNGGFGPVAVPMYGPPLPPLPAQTGGPGQTGAGAGNGPQPGHFPPPPVNGAGLHSILQSFEMLLGLPQHGGGPPQHGGAQGHHQHAHIPGSLNGLYGGPLPGGHPHHHP